MNSYLLLRDNKESGPYSVAELVAMGIKAYDLVWLEGKSAAWRYPSEVEELKAYAPAVEEQPFDRFYKKPALQNEEHKRFEPKPSDENHSIPVAEAIAPAVQTQTNTSTGAGKKVYINFPGAAPQKKSIPAKQPAPVFEERKPSPVLEEPITTYPSASNKKSDKKILYGVIAACLLMLVFTAILLINNSRQRQNLKELNTIVKQMENKEKTQQNTVRASLVENDAPAEATPSTIEPLPRPQIDEGSVYAQKETITPKTSAQRATKNQPADQSAPVVFKESTKPVAKEPLPEEKVSPAAASKENLLKLVSVAPNDYKTGLLGGISNLKFEITNNSLVTLQRVSVEIRYLGPEKKIVRTQTVFFENIAPGEQTTIDVPKSNRGVSIEYAITDIKS
jgi:cytoskeletal protein RodZ